MDRPLTIGHVHNVSLECSSVKSGEYPHLVAHFPCDTQAQVHDCIQVLNIHVCCAAVWLHDMYNVTYKGISVISAISGVVFERASSINIQLTATHCLPVTSNLPLGVLIHQSNFTEVHSSSSDSCSHGLVVSNAANTHITSTTARYNRIGIAIVHTTDIYITESTTTHNVQFGVYLSKMINTYISSVTTHSGQNGMYLYNMSNTHIINTTVKNITLFGMSLSGMNDTFIIDTTVAQNGVCGMTLDGMNRTHTINTTAKYNNEYGLCLMNLSNTCITNTTAAHNGLIGINLFGLSNTHISNVSATKNGGYGIILSESNNTLITNTAVTHNDGSFGMLLTRLIKTHITSTTATHNSQFGMYLDHMDNTDIIDTIASHNGNNGLLLGRLSNTCITNTTVTQNRAAAHYYAVLNGEITIFSSVHTLIYNSSFTNINTTSAANTAELTSLPAIIVLYNSSLHIRGGDFTGNNVSAVKAFMSNITVIGNVTFSNNRATVGTAFMFFQDSILNLTENSHIHFINNRATNIGGVFYISTTVQYTLPLPKNTCFFNTHGSRSKIRFTFVNNSAGNGGDILYGSQLILGLDGDWNCLEAFKSISASISQNSLSLISSDASRVCFCDKTGQPDCQRVFDPTLHSIYPGQTINVSAVVVGQDFGTVAGTVFAQFLPTKGLLQLESSQYITGVTQCKCSQLNYTIFFQAELSEVVLVLTVDNNYVSSIFSNDKTIDSQWKTFYNISDSALERLTDLNHPVYVNISLLPCPAGFMLTSGPSFKCDCSELLHQVQTIHCYIQKQTIGRSGLVWVGMLDEANGTVAVSEYCSLDYCRSADMNVTLNASDSQCNYNHSGILCGGCQPGLSLALGSTQCLQCSNMYLALLIPFTLAGPVLVLFIKVLDLTISQGTLNGLIFYANIVKANEYIFLPWGQTHPLGVFIAWLNLDLGVETCFCHGLSAYSKTWLQFVFPFYIWSIAGLIIIIAKYSDVVAKVMGNNSVPVLATLFFLSYAKLFRTIITALSYTIMHTSHGPKAVWTADGNVDYLGPQHAPLFTTAVAVLLFLWLPYTLLLFLGQWLHRCNCRVIACLLMKRKPFLDAHYGPLKGKHHYWFGALHLVRAAILLISALVPANHASIIVLCILVFSVVLTHFGQMVYRNLTVSVFDTSFFMNLALLAGTNLFISTVGGNPSVAAYTLCGLTFVQFIGLFLFKVFSILKRRERVMRCFRRRRPVEDDWELYEEAALLKEMESDTEDEDSEGSGSMESLPTY